MKPRLICSFAIPVVCFIVSNSLGAAEYFVNKQGSDGNDGLARDKAFLTIHKGLNAIAPGEIETSILSPGTEKIVEKLPLQRLGQPSEVADVIWFLCSDQSSYISGAEIEVNGAQHV